MSDYQYNKVIRFSPNKEIMKQQGVEDVEELIFKLANEYDVNHRMSQYNMYYSNHHPYFDVGFSEIGKQYVDLYLDSSYGEKTSEFGHVKQLSSDDFIMYRELFVRYLQITEKDVKNLCEVEYCYYNCSEPPNYYEEYDYSEV